MQVVNRPVRTLQPLNDNKPSWLITNLITICMYSNINYLHWDCAYLYWFISIDVSRINLSCLWVHNDPFSRYATDNDYSTINRECSRLCLFLNIIYRNDVWNVKLANANVILTAMSLLHTTERDNESQSWTMRSNPAVRNWAKVGWGHNAHSSSVWPRTAGLKPIDREPIKIQLRVDPTSNCDPRPSDTVRIPPKCSAIYV